MRLFAIANVNQEVLKCFFFKKIDKYLFPFPFFRVFKEPVQKWVALHPITNISKKIMGLKSVSLEKFQQNRNGGRQTASCCPEKIVLPRRKCRVSAEQTRPKQARQQFHRRIERDSHRSPSFAKHGK